MSDFVTETPTNTQKSANTEIALQLLDKLGISAADLLGQQRRPNKAPSFAAFAPVVSTAVSAGTRATYAPYWRYAVEAWAERALNEVRPSEIKALSELVKSNVVRRRNARGGTSAVETFISAMRCLYQHAEDDELITHEENSAAKVGKPARKASTRFALPPARLAEINRCAATTGNDPELDSLILRLHTETACRRQGALNLRPTDLDPQQCLVFLREKADTFRWQPVSPTLMKHLQAHVRTRQADESDRLLRYRSGKPVTSRRYDHLWNRMGKHLPWVRIQGVSAHWLRHTTLTWVERNFSTAIARGYAGHTPVSSANTNGSIAIYTKATPQEIAAALATLTGERHPLAAPAFTPHGVGW